MTEYTKRQTTIVNAINEALNVFQELGEEMREAFDNTPENLQQSAAGEAREAAADALESISEPSFPKELEEEQVILMERVRTEKQMIRRTRPERRDDAINTLDRCIEALQDIADNESASATARSEAGSLADELEDIKSNAEAVEFPSRF